MRSTSINIAMVSVYTPISVYHKPMLCLILRKTITWWFYFDNRWVLFSSQLVTTFVYLVILLEQVYENCISSGALFDYIFTVVYKIKRLFAINFGKLPLILHIWLLNILSVNARVPCKGMLRTDCNFSLPWEMYSFNVCIILPKVSCF